MTKLLQLSEVHILYMQMNTLRYEQDRRISSIYTKIKVIIKGKL